VVTAGEPSATPLDIALESSVAMAVSSVEGSINGSMMIALLPGASADISNSEALADELAGAIDAIAQVLDSDVSDPAAASGVPTIAPDISVALLAGDSVIGGVLLFLAAPAAEAVEAEAPAAAAPPPAAAPAAAPAPAPAQAPAAAPSAPRMPAKPIDALAGVEMEVTIEVGRTRIPVGELLQLQPGQVLELDREVGAPLDMFINGTLLARGEIVIIDDQFGFRVTSVVSQD
jgi:flagellar motor switch protein FliN/FliY